MYDLEHRCTNRCAKGPTFLYPRHARKLPSEDYSNASRDLEIPMRLADYDAMVAPCAVTAIALRHARHLLARRQRNLISG